MKKLALLPLMFIAACSNLFSNGNSNPNPAPPPLVSQQPPPMPPTASDARTRAKSHAELGWVYYQDKQYGQALEEARKAVAIDATYPLAHNLLALVNMDLGQNQAAQESFERALKLAPNDPNINNNYGWFLCQTGQEAKSIAYFKAAINNPLYGNPGQALVNSGVCLDRTKDTKGAEAAFVAALRLDPENAAALYRLADLYYRTGRFAEARQRVTDLHRVTEPDAQSTWLALRIAHSMDDRTDEAAYTSLLRRRFPNSNEVLLLNQGKLE